MRTISRVEVFPIGVPITRGFTFASGSAGVAGGKADIVLVKVTDSDGTVGWGEGRPMPHWSYETIETVVAALRRHLIPAVLGTEIWDRVGLHRRMFAVIGRGPSTGQPVAKASLDMAVHDLCARVAGVPLRCFLGGSSAACQLPLSWTCTAHAAAEVAADMEAGLAAGFTHFNFKAAVSAENDTAVAGEIVRRAPRGAFIWADCNQGFQLPEAVHTARAFEQAGVHLLEQPLASDQFHLMANLRARTRIALAVDESSVSPGDFFAHARSGVVDYLVAKLTRTGGIWPTTQQLAVAQAAGLPAVASGLTDGLLSKLAAAHVAAAAGIQHPLALNGSQFLDESAFYPAKSHFERDGAIFLGQEPGLGVQPDEAAVQAHLLPVFAGL